MLIVLEQVNYLREDAAVPYLNGVEELKNILEFIYTFIASLNHACSLQTVIDPGDVMFRNPIIVSLRGVYALLKVRREIKYIILQNV